MTMEPANAAEWFTPIWVVPTFLLIAVVLYAVVHDPAPATVLTPAPVAVTP